MSGFRKGDKVRIIAEPNYSGDVKFAGLTGVVVEENIPPGEDTTGSGGIYSVHLDGENDNRSSRQFYGNDMEFGCVFKEGDKVRVVASPRWRDDTEYAGLVGEVKNVYVPDEGFGYDLSGIYTVFFEDSWSHDVYGVDLEPVVGEEEPQTAQGGTQKAADYPVATVIILTHNLGEDGPEEITLIKQADNFWVYSSNGERSAAFDQDVDDLLSPMTIEVLLP